MKFDLKWLVGILIAAISIIPGYLTLQGIPNKSLSYKIPYSFSIHPIGIDLVPEMKVTIKGNEITDPYFNVLSIKNTGNVPITRQDFLKKLVLTTENSVQIIIAEIENTSPENIQVNIQFDSDSLIIDPLLLNPNDEINLSIVTEGGLPNFNLRSRIIGITRIAKIESSKSELPIANIIISGIFVVASLLGLPFLYSKIFGLSNAYNDKQRMIPRIKLNSQPTVSLPRKIAYLITLSLFLIKTMSLVYIANLIGMSFMNYMVFDFLLSVFTMTPVFWKESSRRHKKSNLTKSKQVNKGANRRRSPRK